MGGPPGSPIIVCGEPSRVATRPAQVRHVSLLLLCVIIALAGCARLGSGGAEPGDSGGVGGGSTANPSPGKPDDPVDPPIAIPDPVPPFDRGKALRQEPEATVTDARSMRIERFTIGADGRTVVAYWWGGNPDCFGLKGVRVETQNGTPLVTVLEGMREAARGRACTMEAVMKSAVVVLEAPILTDAANPQPDAGEAVIFEGTTEVEPARDVTDPRPHAVSGYGLSPDGLTLSIYYVGGVTDCYGLASASARRAGGAGPLTVSVREGWIAADYVACDDIGLAKVVTLALDGPLMLSASLEQ